MFDNCALLGFAKQNKLVTSMTSCEKESFDFVEPVVGILFLVFNFYFVAEGAVENWMNLIEAEMQKTLLLNTKEAVFHYAFVIAKFCLLILVTPIASNGFQSHLVWLD